MITLRAFSCDGDRLVGDETNTGIFMLHLLAKATVFFAASQQKIPHGPHGVADYQTSPFYSLWILA
jgi:hypothetical protein